MIQYFTDNLWMIWTIITVVCLIIELGSGDFFVTCFAIGAIFGVITSIIGLPFWIQVVIFAAFSVVSIFFVRPSIVNRLHSKGEDRKSNADALIGSTGIVIEEVKPGYSGYVKVDGDEWKAITDDDGVLVVGDKVKIIDRESIVIKVTKQ